jgi:hypothetical protein
MGVYDRGLPRRAPCGVLGRNANASINDVSNAPCVLAWRPPGNPTDEIPS